MEEYARLQQRNDEIWDILEDPTLPPLDRQMLNEEMLRNTIRIVILERAVVWEFDDDEDTAETIESDEYDREGLIANDDFDLANEV